MDAEIDPLAWCCRMCRRPVIDHDPYALSREITPFATIGDLMGSSPIPAGWRPIARRLWIRRLERRVRRELEAHRVFAERIGAISGAIFRKEVR